MRRTIYPALLVAACASAPAAADEGDYPNDLAASDDAIILQPISPWNIDFGENRCRLTRVFGSSDDQHLLYFEQAAPGSNFGMTLAGSQVQPFTNVRRLYIGMERDETMRLRERFARGDVAGVGPAVILTSFGFGSRGPEGAPQDALRSAGIDLAEAETADRIVLQRSGRVLSFETGNMMPPFQALNTCTKDLLRDWGLDPEQHSTYYPPRWSNQRTLARRLQQQYPSEALRAGEQGIFRLRVIVEADGTVSDCHLEESTEMDRLESPACREMRRARFEPARDAEGNPMRSFYATTISYSIGG